VLEVRFLVVERLPGAVLVRDDAHRERPLEGEAGIIEEQPAFHARCVELADLITGVRPVAQHLIAVGEALRDVERAVVVLVELYGDMLQRGARRALTGARRSVPYYPMMFVAPNGRVFMAGPEQQTAYVNTCNAGTWIQGLLEQLRRPELRLGGDVRGGEDPAGWRQRSRVDQFGGSHRF